MTNSNETFHYLINQTKPTKMHPIDKAITLSIIAGVVSTPVIFAIAIHVLPAMACACQWLKV